MERLIVAISLLVLMRPCAVAQVIGSSTTSTPEINRRVMVDERSVQVVRSRYQPGAAEPPGHHSFDVVIIPLSSGRMEVEIAGKNIPWKPREAFFIGRGVEHHIANKGKKAVDLISIRIP